MEVGNGGTGMSYFYLASPYTSDRAEIREDRYIAARSACIWLLNQKIFVYSPIVHCHDISKAGSLPVHFEYWLEYNKAMFAPAQGFIILGIPGWIVSRGVREEIRMALESEKPIQLLKTPMHMIQDDYQLVDMSSEDIASRIGWKVIA